MTSPTLRIAANSNAALILNGNIITRKVTRFQEQTITADLVPLPLDYLL